MDALHAIRTRRSIRKFKSDEISEEHLNILLDSAMHAPSARNTQPWEFIIVRNQEMRNRIASENPNAAMAKDAPLSIIVCGDTKKEAFPGFWIQDCSAATQNIMLAAHALGLGTVWTGVHPRTERLESIRNMFNIPEHLIPLSLIVVGHPDQELPIVDRFDSSKIVYETY